MIGPMTIPWLLVMYRCPPSRKLLGSPSLLFEPLYIIKESDLLEYNSAGRTLKSIFIHFCLAISSHLKHGFQINMQHHLTTKANQSVWQHKCYWLLLAASDELAYFQHAHGDCGHLKQLDLALFRKRKQSNSQFKFVKNESNNYDDGCAPKWNALSSVSYTLILVHALFEDINEATSESVTFIIT
jgi:hypothetical protein